MLEGRDDKSVARELKLQPGHVAVLLHRAKSELRECVNTAQAATHRDSRRAV